MVIKKMKDQKIKHDSLIVSESIEDRILRIRGINVMAANVLKSDNAVKVSVYVVRAFIKLREMLLSNKEFSDKLKKLEQKVEKHDKTIHLLVVTLGHLMTFVPGKVFKFSICCTR